MKSAGNKAAADVPMLDLSRQYAGIRNEVLAAVARVCDSQHYILGEEVVAFEREFAALCATADCVGCASGTDGLWLALAAAGVQPEEAVHVGDSLVTDVGGARAAGIRPLHFDPFRLCRLGDHQHAASMGEVVELVRAERR